MTQREGMSKHHKNPSSKLETIEEVVQGVLDTTGYAVRYKNGKEIGVVQVRVAE